MEKIKEITDKLNKYFPKDDRFYLLNKIITPWYYERNSNVYVGCLERMKEDDKNNQKKYPIRYFIYYDLYLPVYRWWNQISEIPCHIKAFIQRGKRGWADRDLWSYDFYNARVNKEAITKLKEIQHIIPLWEEGEDEAFAQKRWHDILDDMIFAFGQVEKIGDGSVYIWGEHSSECYASYRKNNPELYKDIHFQTKEEHDRMKKGMSLFIEHYFSLWD